MIDSSAVDQMLLSVDVPFVWPGVSVINALPERVSLPWLWPVLASFRLDRGLVHLLYERSIGKTDFPFLPQYPERSIPANGNRCPIQLAGYHRGAGIYPGRI